MEASSPTVTGAASRHGFAGVAWRTLRPDVPVLAVLIAYIGLAHLLSRTIGIPEYPALDLSWRPLTLWTLTYVIGALVWIPAFATFVEGKRLSEPATWRWVAGRFLDPRALTGFALLFLLLPPFMTAFVGFKAAIPLVHPFAWDVTFMEWDRLVHFGVDPWAALQPLLGSPDITTIVDRIYYAWFPLLWITVVWQAWHGALCSEFRSQFLLAFVCGWILLGTLGGTLLSSAGPVYYAEVVGGHDPFAPLVEYLRDVHAENSLVAVQLHDLLWQSYVNPEEARIAQGISAMPSLHVGMATLMSLIGFRVNRWIGWAYLAFAVAILIGSVHLAWHYAIDGYVAALLAIAVWWACGRITRAWSRMDGASAERLRR